MTEPKLARLLVLTAGGLNPQIMINALSRHFPNLVVLQEEYESKSVVLKRRAKRLGWAMALGQLGTMIVSRLGKGVAQKRTEQIILEFGLLDKPDDAIPVMHVPSLNSDAARDAIAKHAPDLIFTISCRLLSLKTLAAISCPIVNFHAGINPAYRGQMGGYWSRVENDDHNFGATLHYVDAGTDTGNILAEVRIRPQEHDTISTYPLLITAAGIDTTITTLAAVLDGTASAYPPAGRSVLRFPPPIWTYVFNGLRKGIW